MTRRSWRGKGFSGWCGKRSEDRWKEVEKKQWGVTGSAFMEHDVHATWLDLRWQVR